MKDELFESLCMECVEEEVKELREARVDELLGAALIISMSCVLKKLEKKLKYRGLIK